MQPWPWQCHRTSVVVSTGIFACLQLGKPAQPFQKDPATLLWFDPLCSNPTFASQTGSGGLIRRVELFQMWLSTQHGASATPEVAEALLYAWLGQDRFLLSLGQLSLVRESMQQVGVFLKCLQSMGSVGCSAIIVALHANKQRGQGNFGDSKSSMTTCVVQACMSAFVPGGVAMLVMQAMPLQQFPVTCGEHEGSKPPFLHPRKYHPVADHLGNMFVRLQLQVLRNNMLRLGYPPAQCMKAVVSCGGPAARRFFTQDPDGLEGHGSLKADLAEVLLGDAAVGLIPCFKTFHPAAGAYKGYGALADTALAFKQAGLVTCGLQPSMALLPKLPELQEAVSKQPGSRPLHQVLAGYMGIASILQTETSRRQNAQWEPAYIRLGTGFVRKHLDLAQLPDRAQIAVDQLSSPMVLKITATLHTSTSSGANRSYKPQQQVRILGLQHLLPLLSLSSRHALVEMQDARTLRITFSTAFVLDDSDGAKEQLQSILKLASQKQLVGNFV